MKISKDGREWLNDPGDERDIPEYELFESFAYMGTKPEEIVTDLEFRERYRKWLEAGKPEDDAYAKWLRRNPLPAKFRRG